MIVEPVWLQYVQRKGTWFMWLPDETQITSPNARLVANLILEAQPGGANLVELGEWATRGGDMHGWDGSGEGTSVPEWVRIMVSDILRKRQL